MSALDLLGGLVLEDGRTWGEAVTVWQRADAAALLDVSAEVPKLHVWTRPRGGSKTTDGAGAAIAALIEQFPPSARGYAFAVDAEQSALLTEAAAGLVQRSGLTGLLEVQSRRIVNRQTDAQLVIMSADSASAYGLRGCWYWLDEFPMWPQGHRALWTAVVSAVPKVAGCRLVAVGSAGDPASWVARLLDGARGSPTWRVSEIDGPLPWVSVADLEEQQRLLPRWEYERLHLNRWTAPADRLTTVDDLRACVVLDGPRERIEGRRYAIGVDLGLKNDRTVVAVCSADRDDSAPRVALDRLAVWQGTRESPVDLGEIEQWILQAHKAYGRPRVIADPWQSAQLCQRLTARDVRVTEYAFTAPSVSRLALRLYQLIADHALELPDDAELLDELAHVRLKETSPGVYRLDHDADRHDDRAIALALAAHQLLDTAARPVPIVAPADLRSASYWSAASSLDPGNGQRIGQLS